MIPPTITLSPVPSAYINFHPPLLRSFLCTSWTPSIRRLLAMNLANHRAPGLVLHIFLVCFSHSAIASLAPGLFDSAHEAATGLNDAHEATAARSALDTLAGHTNPHTNPSTICRRFLGGCLGGLRPAAGARTSTTISHASPSIGESTDTERLTFLEKLIKSFTSKLRGFHDQFVLRSRAVRDNWHLGE